MPDDELGERPEQPDPVLAEGKLKGFPRVFALELGIGRQGRGFHHRKRYVTMMTTIRRSVWTMANALKRMCVKSERAPGPLSSGRHIPAILRWKMYHMAPSMAKMRRAKNTSAVRRVLSMRTSHSPRLRIVCQKPAYLAEEAGMVLRCAHCVRLLRIIRIA